MAMATAVVAITSLSPLSTTHKIITFPSSSTHKPKSYPPLISSITLSKQHLRNHNHTITFNPITKSRNVRASASSEDAAISTAESTTQQIVSATTTSGDDGVSNVISILLFIAFVGLSIVTVGVIYIGVTDFLQKREKEKFEKEEAEKNKKKKGGKKNRARARTGPRGFGQKIDEDDD